MSFYRKSRLKKFILFDKTPLKKLHIQILWGLTHYELLKLRVIESSRQESLPAVFFSSVFGVMWRVT